MSTTTNAPPPLPVYLNVGISGVSGCLSWLNTHPFELIKNKTCLNPSLSMSTIIKDTSKNGIANLWKGLSGGLARQIVYTSCRLGFYDPVKAIVTQGSTDVTIQQRAAAGALAGMFAALLSSPVEVCLVMQSKVPEKIGVPEAFRRVLKDKGVAGLWAGGVPLTARAGVVGISQVAMFDQAKATLNRWNTEKQWGLTSSHVFVGASSFTAIFYAFVTMPIELARVRMSAQTGSEKKYTSMVQAIRLIAREEGVMHLYSAFLPYTCRCGVHTIATFFIMDLLKAEINKRR